MPDTDKSLEILITTKADLAGARAIEAQLEQDIAKAKELGETYDDPEDKLKNLRGIIVEKPASDKAATSSGIPAANEQIQKASSTEAVRSGSEHDLQQKETRTEAGGDGPLSWVKAAIEGLRLAFEAMPKIFGMTANSSAASTENRDRILIEDQGRPVTDKLDNAAATAPALANGSAARATLEGAQAKEQTPSATGQDENEIVGQVTESHAQAIQFAGEKMRAAFEQNTQITVSLFNRTLELIDQQNQKLSEVNQRIAELNGQIKSLKNL